MAIGALAVEVQAEPVVRQQARGEAPPPRRLRVTDRLDDEAVLGEPLSRSGVQGRQLIGRRAAQFERQQIAEELVVAEGRALRVDRRHECAGLLELVEDARAAGVAGQPVGQRPGDLLQDRSAQQQSSHFRRLAVEDLREQVLGNRALTAREVRGKAFGIGVAGERQRCQPEARCPTLSPRHELLECPAGDLHACGLEELTRLLGREAQVGRAQLPELTFQAQPVKAQARIVPRGQHESQLGRRLGHERLELVEALRIDQLVEVVDDQPQRLVEGAEVLQQALDEVFLVELTPRGECSDDARSRAGGAQRVE